MGSVADDEILNITNTLNIQSSAILNISNRDGTTLSSPTATNTSLFYDTNSNTVSYLNTTKISSEPLGLTGPTGAPGANGNSSVTGATGFSGGLPNVQYFTGTITTTNGSFTDIVSIPTTNDTVYYIESRLVGITLGNPFVSVSIEASNGFANTGNTLNRLPGNSRVRFRNGNNYNGRNLASSNNITVQVRGASSTTVHWKASCIILTETFP
jgi:hypothetical protein